jgi:hypothetical protein
MKMRPLALLTALLLPIPAGAQLAPTLQMTMTNSGNYSGGIENFMRLLENWGANTLTYNGSMVALFSSQYATNTWLPTGNYYNAPTRHWAFDSNFANFSKLPPLTPLVENYVSP